MLLMVANFAKPQVKVRIRDAYLNYRTLFSGYTLKVRIGYAYLKGRPHGRPHLVLLYVYDLLSLVHVQKYVCVYEYDVLQPCWIFVRRTRVRRTNVRASFL